MASTSSTPSIDAIGLVPSSTAALPANAGISQQDFLQIMLTQLQFQDPLKPIDNEQFVAELAQFSALEVNTEQSAKIDSLLTIQATNQAVSLIGKTVQVAGATSTGVNTNAVGTVTAIDFSTGAPLLSVTESDSTVLTSIQLSSVTLVQ